MLADALACLPAIALLLGAGLGLQAVAAAPLERSIAARLGYAYLLGAAWIGLAAWTIGYLLGASLGRGLFLAVGAAPVAAGIALFARRRFGGDRPARAWRRPSPESAAPALVVAAASFALLAGAATEPVSDFDGRMTWGTTAKYLVADRSVLPEALRDARAFVIHPRYPILMPLVQALVATVGGTSIESAAIRPVYVLFLPALAAVAWPVARRCGGRRGGALAMTLVFSTPMLLWYKEGGANGTYSDLPLAAFLGAGLALLVHPRAVGQRWRGWPAGLLLAAAAGSKNEGMALAATEALAAVAAARLAGRSRRAQRSAAPLAALLVVACGIAVVVGWRWEIPNRNDEAYFETVSPRAILSGLRSRAPLVASEIASRTLDPASWGALFWVAPLLLAAGRRSLRGPAVLVAAAVMAAELAQILAAYAVVPDPWILSVTWNRFLVQLTMPLVLILAAASGGALREAGWQRLQRRVPESEGPGSAAPA